jgi:hypothetical protein
VAGASGRRVADRSVRSNSHAHRIHALGVPPGRQGGDEYLVLLPSVSSEAAVALLDELRRKLADLAYPSIEERTTVSIGLCLVTPRSLLTDREDREVRERATAASAYAKGTEDQPRKNCIATYRGARFLQHDLYIAAPNQE